MKVTHLLLRNFRNFETCDLKTGNSVNILYGNNAQGKTNILEGIYYGAFGLSHRTSKEEELLKIGEEGFLDKVTFENRSGEQEIYVKRISGLRTQKEIKYNSNPIKPKEHYGVFNVVMFSPEDLQIVKGDPALRRRFMDMDISQTNKIYYSLLLKYNKIIKQRNRFLKESLEKNNFDKIQLDTWDSEFSKVAARIISIRIDFLEKISKVAVDIYSDIAKNKENLEICYEQKLNNSKKQFPKNKSIKEWEEFYLKILLERRQIDRYRTTTGVGPHRDDLVFIIDEKQVKSFGSQGQQRTVVLAIKLAELEYLKQEVGEYPVLLLDDVMSELDVERREQILGFIDGRVQTFITVNDKNLIPERECNNYFYIKNGQIKEG